MAIQPKAQDPTAAALSAIEEALNLAQVAEATTPEPKPDASKQKSATKAEPRPEPKFEMPPEPARKTEPAQPRSSEVEEKARSYRRMTEEPKVEAKAPPQPAALAPAPAANDDRRSVGQILQAFQVRSSPAPLALAGFGSALWLGLVGFYATTLGPIALQQVIVLGLAGLGPVVFFFVSAMIMRRAQEMRLTAQALTEVAMRLAEPETVATEQVVTLSQAIRREVASMGDGIERALARASELETVVRAEVSTLERSYTENERRIRALIDELSSEREAIVVNADRVRQAISGAHEALSRDLETASIQIAERVGEAGSRVSELLGSKGEQISQTLGRTGDELIHRISVNGSEIVNRLAETGDGVTAKLTNATDDISTHIGARIAEIDDRLKTTGEALVADLTGRGNDVAARIEETGAHIADTISSRGNDLADRLAETGERIENTITVHGGELETRISTTGDQITTLISERANAVYDLFHTSGHELASQLENHHLQLSEHLEREVVELTGRFATSAEEAITAIGVHADRVTEHIADRLQAFEGTVLTQGARVTEALSERVSDFETSVVANGDRISGEMADRLVAFENTVVSQGEILAGQIAEHAERFTIDVAARLETVENAIAIHGGDLADRIGQHAERFTQDVGTQLSSVENIFTLHGEALAVRLETQATATAELLEERVREFDERATSKAQTIAGSLDALITKIDTGLDSRAKSLNETLAQRALEVAQVLGEGGRQVTRALDTKASEIDAILLERSTALSETLGAKASEINKTLGGRATEIASTLDERISNFEERVVGRLNVVSEEIDLRGRQVAENLGAKATEISVTLAARLGEISTTLDQRGSELAGSLDSRMIQLTDRLQSGGKALDQIIGERSVELQNLIDTQGPLLVEAISARGSEIATEIANVGEIVTNAIDNRASAIVRNIGHKETELTDAIDRSSENLRTTLDAASRSSVQNLVSTKQVVQGEIVAVLEQLRETSGLLKQIIEHAGDNLGDAEATLATRVQDFSQAIDQINMQVHALTETAVTTLESADAVAGRLEHSNQYLSGVASQVAHTQEDLDRTLIERRNALEETILGMGQRTEEFDQLMRTFSVAIDDAFRRAEARARDIGGFITDATKSAAGVIEEQYDEVRRSTSREQELTISGLRSAFGEANAEMVKIFAAALDRFRSAASEIQGLTTSVGRELETTREELRRGTVELPRETAEQAAAMRRVVAEQIKALNELTDIIARSGRAYDVAEPVPAQTKRRVETARITEAPRAVEPPPAPRVTDNVRMNEPYRPEPVRVEEAPPLRRPMAPVRKNAQPAADKGAGWLSDLLARASREEGETTTASRATAGSSLDTITLDIARLVDHEAAVDLWDRYNRGESNVFTRRLYTAQGQQTFEDIRRRYRTEADFRDSIDRYTGEFERLLSEVSRDDRDGILTRTYLTSETGKVYTLLAHAAGHFD